LIAEEIGYTGAHSGIGNWDFGVLHHPLQHRSRVIDEFSEITPYFLHQLVAVRKLSQDEFDAFKRNSGLLVREIRKGDKVFFQDRRGCNRNQREQRNRPKSSRHLKSPIAGGRYAQAKDCQL
jgi:hypothetical protein